MRCHTTGGPQSDCMAAGKGVRAGAPQIGPRQRPRGGGRLCYASEHAPRDPQLTSQNLLLTTVRSARWEVSSLVWTLEFSGREDLCENPVWVAPLQKKTQHQPSTALGASPLLFFFFLALREVCAR